MSFAVSQTNTFFKKIINSAPPQTDIIATDSKLSNLTVGSSVSMGPYNVLLGENALNSYTLDNADPPVNAINNVAIGVNALTALTTGSNNTAVGDGALVAVETGSGNIAVGLYAGNTITTGNNNIVIGKEAQAASTLDDQIIIGNSTTGTVAGQILIGNSTTYTGGTYIAAHILRNLSYSGSNSVSIADSGSIINLTSAPGGTIYTLGLPDPAAGDATGLYYEFILNEDNSASGQWNIGIPGKVNCFIFNNPVAAINSDISRTTILFGNNAKAGARISAVSNGVVWTVIGYPTVSGEILCL